MFYPLFDFICRFYLQLAAVEEALKSVSDNEKANLLDLKEKLTEVISLLGGKYNHIHWQGFKTQF